MINPVFEVRGLAGGNRTSNITGSRQLLCIRINTGQAEYEAESACTSTIMGRGIGGDGLFIDASRYRLKHRLV
ncbi:hypothetical protein MCOR25_001743 [Pyricularia grisea]|nr:hypothetical protein MCOR25_001743 [Pyricularia grisea]